MLSMTLAVRFTHTSADRVDDECLCQDDHLHTSSTGEATRHWPGAREILRGETGKATAHNSLRLLEWERQVILGIHRATL
jgi:hypothetical protein